MKNSGAGLSHNLILVLLITISSSALAQSPLIMKYADMVLYNGHIITADDNFSIAEAVAIAAVCFGILCKSRQKDVKFDWDEILSFRGKTGPYLQYAHARQASILRKYGKKVTGEVDLGRLDDPEEFELAMWLSVFPRAVEKAAAEFEPSCIANYLLDLAAVYSRYSQDSVRHKILSDDEELTAARVLLVSCVRTVLQKGLYLLGIIAPEQM